LQIRRLQPDHDGALHPYYTTCWLCHMPDTDQERRFLPGLNADISAAEAR
jgi:hypothetical protein